MRRWLPVPTALMGLATLLAAPAAAQPPAPFIVAMAQHFVQVRLMTSSKKHYYIKFDTARLYSQPRQTLWVVVGGYVSDQNNFNSFTAAVLLECPEFEKVECWSLEKLSINGKIVLDQKRI